MKKAIKTISLLCVLIFTIMTLGGCGTEPGVSKTQTDFSIVDEQGTVNKFLTADNSEVVKIKNTVEGYFKAMTERSYKTINGSEEYGYFTKTGVDALTKKGDIEATVKYYKDNQLVTSYAGIDNLKASFNKDFSACTVSVTAKMKIMDANASYLQTSIAKKGEIAGFDFSIKFVKEAGVWNIAEANAPAPHVVK